MPLKIDLQQFIVLPKVTLLEVMRVINQNGKGVAFVVDIEGKLVGLLTDGDIRRLLLGGARLDDCISTLVKADFVVGYQDEPEVAHLKKMNEHVLVLPIVDRKQKLVDFLIYRHQVYLPVANPDLTGNELTYLVDAFTSTWISSSGEYLARFEKEFSDFCGVNYGVAVSNGTVAIQLALLALGVGPGDEVIIPDLTFAATANAVLHVGATPVIVDVEMNSWGIDPLCIESAISPKTKAIIPVHLYGQPCDMTAIMGLAKANNLFVIEDCAEAHGALYKGQKVGSFGDIGCFSFFGNKVLTTGEGGMCVTNSPELVAKMEVLKCHGMSQDKKYWHDCVGYNFRMTNLQAAIGCAQLERLSQTLEHRALVESKYRECLSDILGLQFQEIFQDRHKITWLVSILVPRRDRDKILKKLKLISIDARPFFYSLSMMPLYQTYVRGGVEVSQALSLCGLNLPTHIGVNDDHFENIRSVILSVGSE